jgi:succinate dehydrogenase / fumarate reductase membrane anchor subunit
MRDWLIQRGSAVILLAYIMVLLALAVKAPVLNYDAWKAIFMPTWFRVFSLMAFLSLFLHSWVGVWTIATDYIKNGSVRFLFLFIVAVALIAYFFWSLEIIQGVL